MMKILEKFERLKTDLDKEIIAQEQSFREDIQQINRELESKKRVYQQLVKNIEQDQVHLDEEKVTAARLMKEEDLLSKELDRTTQWIDKIRSKIKQEQHRISNAEEHMDDLQKYAEQIKKSVLEKAEEITGLVNKSKMQEVKIIDLQKEILSKFLKERKKMDEDTRFLGALKERFQTAFNRKKEILSLVNRIDHELTDYRKDFELLIKRAKIIQFKGGEKNVEKHINELEKKYHEMEKRRKTFEKEVTTLTSWIKNL